MPVRNWMESTCQKTVDNYKGDWLRFRNHRELVADNNYIFSDGSSDGWHAAIFISEDGKIHKIARFEETPNRNINAELNGAILGLSIATPNSSVVVVHDYLGVGAWGIGEWNITKSAVKDKVDLLHKIINERNLEVRFIHHEGHQNRKKGDRPICHSSFTKWNCACDELCSSKVEVDTIEEFSRENSV